MIRFALERFTRLSKALRLSDAEKTKSITFRIIFYRCTFSRWSHSQPTNQPISCLCVYSYARKVSYAMPILFDRLSICRRFKLNHIVDFLIAFFVLLPHCGRCCANARDVLRRIQWRRTAPCHAAQRRRKSLRGSTVNAPSVEAPEFSQNAPHIEQLRTRSG